MNNLDLYNKVRTVPQNARKGITGGRLKGMTDINPMWRIKTLTEQFGPVGMGWYIEPLYELEIPGADGEMMARVDINLYVKYGDEWSKPIHGTGGAMLVVNEKNGLRTDDEAFKKAYTDAISVACKMLGIGADVYWDKDTESKYQTAPEVEETEVSDSVKDFCTCERCGGEVKPVPAKSGKKAQSVTDLVVYSKNNFGGHIYCADCMRAIKNGK